MHITRLSIERVRNIKMAALPCLQPFNVFMARMAGKTSVLEAIHLLATGRSFRTHLPRNYIQHEQNHALIFAQAGQDKIGIQKMTSGEQVIKVNGDSIATQGQLAKLFHFN
jgi:DNA replication and repair protein RecF